MNLFSDNQNEKVASGFTLSLVLTVVLCSIFVFLQYIWYKGMISNAGELSWLFFVVFLCLFLCIEWFVDRENSRVKQMQEEELENLRKLEVYRRELLAEISHELRTPIFAVQGFLHTLIESDEEDEEIRQRFLLKAQKNADRLSNLVNDLLVLTQMEAGEIEMKMRHFVLHDLIVEVIESLEDKLTHKGRNISCKVESNISKEVRVFADRNRIQQVLTNLVDNAIKYGNQHGHILIKLEGQGDRICISVIDDGAGIAAEHLGNIFRRFYRIDKSRSRDTGGTGLGLAICKHFVEAHGDILKVESVVGKGTTFYFHLPTKGKALE